MESIIAFAQRSFGVMLMGILFLITSLLHGLDLTINLIISATSLLRYPLVIVFLPILVIAMLHIAIYLLSASIICERKPLEDALFETWKDLVRIWRYCVHTSYPALCGPVDELGIEHSKAPWAKPSVTTQVKDTPPPKTRAGLIVAAERKMGRLAFWSPGVDQPRPRLIGDFSAAQQSPQMMDMRVRTPRPVGPSRLR